MAFAFSRRACAYRPFDGTDAAVSPTGEFELELEPVGFLKIGPQRFLVAPGTVLNLGVFRDWEVVLQGDHLILLDGTSNAARFRLVDTELLLKGVLREGTLQERSGPSIALETGFLLPTINDQPGAGVAANLIVSQQWTAVALHLNAKVARTRAGNLDLFGGLILEGPQAWTIRPVAEVYVEREFGVASVVSGLAGGIWPVSDSLAFDAGARVARVDHDGVFELRAGLTWSTFVWKAE
jgi:hypothetical protein